MSSRSHPAWATLLGFHPFCYRTGYSSLQSSVFVHSADDRRHCTKSIFRNCSSSIIHIFCTNEFEYLYPRISNNTYSTQSILFFLFWSQQKSKIFSLRIASFPSLSKLDNRIGRNHKHNLSYHRLCTICVEGKLLYSSRILYK